MEGVRNHIQINLAENHEGKQHNDHRHLRLTDTAKNTGMNLIGSAEPVKQAVAAYEERSVSQDLRILIEVPQSAVPQ